MTWTSPPIRPTQDRVRTAPRHGKVPFLARVGAALAWVVILTTACGSRPALSDFGEALLGAVGTPPSMPTAELPQFDGNVLSPVFSVPQVPEDTLQPIVGSPPDWWFLVPVHRDAYLGGSNGRDYHYLVALSAEDMRDYYEEVMGRGDWEIFTGTIPSGSYSMMSYSRDDTLATIYISPHDGGSLISIIIE